MNAVSILEKSVAEIQAGGWICGDLCNIHNYDNDGQVVSRKKDVKQMACAVGMVSLYAGHSVPITINLKGKEATFRYALYPENENKQGKTINKHGRRVLELLYLAIPKKDRSDLTWPGEYNYETGMHEGGDSAGFDPTKAQLGMLSGAIVGYNDGNIGSKKRPSASALAWFTRALKAAQKEQAASQPQSLVVEQPTLVLA